MTGLEVCNNIVITMKEQKVFRAGNSKTVVAIPQEISKRAGLKTGQLVVVDYIDDAVVIRRPQKKSAVKSEIKMSQEFSRWLKNVLKEDAEILDELAVR